MKLTKHLITATAVVALGALALTGCASNGQGGGSGGSAGSSLTIAKPDGSAVLATQIKIGRAHV